MNFKTLKKTVLLWSLILVSTFLFYSFHTADKANKTKEHTGYLSIEKSKVPKSMVSFQNNLIAKCGDGSKKSGKKAKCGAGKCGAGKCGSAKAEAPKPDFMDNDINGDDKVSLQEFSEHSLKEFPKKDKNKDGKLSKEECGMFDKFNLDGDGFVSRSEFTNGHIALFKKLDKNNDGSIDKMEAKGFDKITQGKCGDGKTKSKSRCGTGKCGGGK